MKRRRQRVGRFGNGEAAPAVTTGGCSRVTPAGKTIQVCAKWSKPGAKIMDKAGACKLLRHTAHSDRESFYAIHMDTRGRTIGVEEVAKGTLNGVEVHPREVFKSAILSNAAYILIAHNHPSGDPDPSRQDIDLTKRLADAGQLLGIPVRDHVIVAAEGCTSLRDRYGEGTIAFGRARDAARPRKRRGRIAVAELAAAACPKPKGLSTTGAFWLGVAASLAANVVTALVTTAIDKARSKQG
jgi:proteasome lid subunit RPN8/RPN11